MELRAIQLGCSDGTDLVIRSNAMVPINKL